MVCQGYTPSIPGVTVVLFQPLGMLSTNTIHDANRIRKYSAQSVVKNIVETVVSGIVALSSRVLAFC